jgi:hypothetical protein
MGQAAQTWMSRAAGEQDSTSTAGVGSMEAVRKCFSAGHDQKAMLPRPASLTGECDMTLEDRVVSALWQPSCLRCLRRCTRSSCQACCKGSDAFAACNTAKSDPGRWFLVAVADIPNDQMSSHLSAVAAAVDDAAAPGAGCDAAGEQCSRGENAADGEEQGPVVGGGCDASHGRALP